LSAPLDFLRVGMPALDSVYQDVRFRPVPGGPTYQILRTTEFDAYDPTSQTARVAQLVRQGTPSPAAISDALRAAPRPANDDFAGHDRAAAKLSVGTGPIEQFADVAALIATLPPDEAMVHHAPPIDTLSTSTRVTEEERNVRITGFLYASSHEADNDYHLMVGRAVSAQPETYMTMEVSGLPPGDNPAFEQLSAARTSFKDFFGTHLPAASYDFYHPPIPVVIEGSLFFDMTHATGQAPGPASLKSRIPTIWEVHPVTSISLGRPGLPARESIESTEKFVSPQNEEYTILHTTEKDAYEGPPSG
jgi:hypothetical protein